MPNMNIIQSVNSALDNMLKVIQTLYLEKMSVILEVFSGLQMAYKKTWQTSCFRFSII